MKRKYDVGQQLLACILLIGLFLQSCSGNTLDPKNPAVYEEKEAQGNVGNPPTQVLEKLELATTNSHVSSISDNNNSASFPESTTRRRAIPVYGHYSLEYRMVDLPVTVEQKQSNAKELTAILPDTQVLIPLGKRELLKTTEQKQFNLSSITIDPKVELISTQGGTIQANGLKISIPPDAVTSDTSFSIKAAPSNIELPEGIKPLTPIYAVEPHNIELRDRIKLEFDVDDHSTPVALFIQKDKPEDKKLKKWLAIDPIQVENGKATFEIGSCSSVTLCNLNLVKNSDTSTLPQTQKKFQEHNIIRPGLNYRALCENASCPWHAETMIINRGFNSSFKPDDDIMNKDAKCPTCQEPLQDTESIKQVILFQAQGMVKYWEATRGAKPASSPFTAQDDKLVIYGEVGNTVTYKSVIFDVSPTPYNPKLSMAVVKFDASGNPIGSIFDLGRDGAYKNVKLLIGKFFDGNYYSTKKGHVFERGFTKGDFEKTVGATLGQKGFNWKCTGDEDEFLRELPEYDIAWIISWCSNKIKNNNFVDQVTKFHKSGKGLMLWEDDYDPYAAVEPTHINSVLQQLFGMKVNGNDPGQKEMLAAANCNTPLTFSKVHPITRGISKLYEGYTICRPNISPLPPSVKSLAISSANHPNIMYVNETSGSGRVVIDCGFTKLYENLWNTAGTARYVVNATCWLSGFPYDNT